MLLEVRRSPGSPIKLFAKNSRLRAFVGFEIRRCCVRSRSSCRWICRDGCCRGQAVVNVGVSFALLYPYCPDHGPANDGLRAFISSRQVRVTHRVFCVRVFTSSLCFVKLTRFIPWLLPFPQGPEFPRELPHQELVSIGTWRGTQVFGNPQHGNPQHRSCPFNFPPLNYMIPNTLPVDKYGFLAWSWPSG
jgi:hypothetical protein